MEPIFVETALDVRDWRALQTYIRGRARNTPLSTRQILASLSGVSVVIVALGISHFAFDGRLNTGSVSIGILLGIGGLAVLGLIQRRALVPRPDSSFFAPTRFQFDASGIHTTQSLQAWFVEWRAIEHVGETAEHLFLALNEYSAYVIPKRAMTSMPPADFIARIQTWYAQREANPKLAPAELSLSSASADAQSTPVAAVAHPLNFWRALRSNLAAGLRIFLLRRVSPESIVPTFDQIAALLVIVVSTWVILDWLSKPGPLAFMPWGMSGHARMADAGLLGRRARSAGEQSR